MTEDLRSMYWLDSAVVALVCLGAGLGLWTGFVWQVARVLSLSLAVTGAIVFNEPAGRFLSEQLMRDAGPRVVTATAYVVVFLIIYIVTFYLMRLAHRGVQMSDLEPLDRLLGAALGAGKVALTLACLALAARHYPHPATQECFDQSALAPFLARGMEQAIVWIPDNYKTGLLDGIEGLGEMLGTQAGA